jgi:hypothetical protein
MSAPSITAMRRETGVAGQYAYHVTVDYGDGPAIVTLVGSSYGGRVVMVAGASQVFVDSRVMNRCGPMLTPEWVRAFFAPHDSGRTDYWEAEARF